MDDTDLLINAFLQTATHFFSAGNFRMPLVPYLLSVRYPKQDDINNQERGLNGKSSKRQKACAATRTQ